VNWAPRRRFTHCHPPPLSSPPDKNLKSDPLLYYIVPLPSLTIWIRVYRYTYTFICIVHNGYTSKYMGIGALYRRRRSPVSGNGSRPIQYWIVLFGQAAVFGSRKLFPPQHNSRRAVALARSYHNGSQYNNNNVLYLFTFIFRTKFMDFRVYLRVCVYVCVFVRHDDASRGRNNISFL